MMGIYGRLLQFVKPYGLKLSGAMFCMVIVAVMTAAVAFLVKPVMDDIFINKDILKLKLVPLVLIGVYIIKGVADYGRSYIMSYVGQRIINDLRNKLYRHIQSLSLSFFTKTPTGVIISRITNDVNSVQGAVTNAITGILKDFFTIIGLVGVVFYRDWRSACIAFLFFPLLSFPIMKFGKKLRKFSTKSMKSIGNLTTLLHESITGIRIVKAFGMEEYESNRFFTENWRLFKVLMKRFKIRALSSPVMETMGGIGGAIVIWYGGYRVITGHSTPGSFFSFMAALFMLYEPVKRLNGVNLAVQEGIAAAVRIFSILDVVPEIRDKAQASAIPPVSREIEFKNISFKYENELVLRNINLKVKSGEVLAIVGPSGGGKSTMVDLLLRFYDVTGGKITIDGQDIRDVTIKSLRAQISMVTQQTILFDDTVKNNIAYGDTDKSEEEIIKAAKTANAHDFIQMATGGYDAVIGEQGIKLSGGERQRISIARAILKNSPILVLDEATSSLDTESEREVQKGLQNLIRGRTTFIIAHRLSTIKNADRIVVVSRGEIIEEGRHEDLLKPGTYYYKLYQAQFRDDNDDIPDKTGISRQPVDSR